MSPSSSMLLTDKQVGKAEQKQPEWLKVLLGRSFFEACLYHPIRRNELNKYCVSCKEPACQYCMSSGAHRHHRVLNIYRHVYKDVVSLSAMDNYFDCSLIQPYKCNKRMVIALNPLPHSGQTSNIGGSCEVCKRRLTEPHLYHYCSITCKVTAFSRKSRDSVSPTVLSIHSPNKENRRNILKPEKPMNKRKGKPCRAPLF